MHRSILSLLGLFLVLVALPARATLVLDLSYIDTGSPGFDRFEGWAEPALPPTSQLPYAFSATDAVYLHVATGSAAWAQVAVGIAEDQVADAEAAWSAPTPARPEIAGDSYLEAGPLLRDLALVYAFCPGFLTSGQRSRWSAYAEQTLFNVWHPELATWGGHAFPWSGWSIDNPGNNYYYSFLQATMFWGFAKGPGGTDWIAFLRAEKIPPLVAYFQQLAGGGSREGTGYGLSHGRLFELYELWRQSTPEHQSLGAAGSHLADSIEYWRHATLPTFDRYAPIGDLSRESYPSLYDYHRTLMLKARAAVAATPGGGPAAAGATWWLNRISLDEVQSGFNLRDDLLPAGETESAPSSLVYHATGVGHFFARSDWSPSATWMSFMAGPYEESHAHQDQGAFTLFRGDFLAVTENIFTHSGIQQGTEVHNVLRFEDAGDVVPQRNAATTLAWENDGGRIHLEADLSPFYAGSAVSSWQRETDFDAGVLEVHDVYDVEPGVEVFFQVQTPVEPQIVGGVIEAGALRIRPLEPANPTIEILEWPSVDSEEFREGWRVSLSGGSGEFRVRLETDNAALFADGFESGGTAAWSATLP